MLPTLYENQDQIIKSLGYVVIHVEMVHDTRVIRISDTPLPSIICPWPGDSLANWENNTMVVETSNLHPLQRFRNATKRFKIMERFTRVAKNRVNYDSKLNSSETWAGPWSAEIAFSSIGDKPYQYACHEGNYSLPGILAGARREEANSQ